MFNRVEVYYEVMIGKVENKFINVIDYIKK